MSLINVSRKVNAYSQNTANKRVKFASYGRQDRQKAAAAYPYRQASILNVKKLQSVIIVMISSLAFVFISNANATKADPVVLTFSSEAGDLRMELGFVRELQLEATGEHYAIKIIFETEGVNFYNKFAYQFRNLPTDLYVCTEKVITYSKMPYLKDDSFYLPNIKSKERAETLMDTIFYGNNCENYLYQ